MSVTMAMLPELGVEVLHLLRQDEAADSATSASPIARTMACSEQPELFVGRPGPVEGDRVARKRTWS
jgi:hypothetical protein